MNALMLDVRSDFLKDAADLGPTVGTKCGMEYCTCLQRRLLNIKTLNTIWKLGFGRTGGPIPWDAASITTSMWPRAAVGPKKLSHSRYSPSGRRLSGEKPRRAS